MFDSGLDHSETTPCSTSHSSPSAPPCSWARSSMRAAAPEYKAMLDVILGAGVAVFLLVYMTYALLWPEKF